VMPAPLELAGAERLAHCMCDPAARFIAALAARLRRPPARFFAFVTSSFTALCSCAWKEPAKLPSTKMMVSLLRHAGARTTTKVSRARRTSGSKLWSTQHSAHSLSSHGRAALRTCAGGPFVAPRHLACSSGPLTEQARREQHLCGTPSESVSVPLSQALRPH
jgi:hypothetical protein